MAGQLPKTGRNLGGGNIYSGPGMTSSGHMCVHWCQEHSDRGESSCIVLKMRKSLENLRNKNEAIVPRARGGMEEESDMR